MRRLAAPLRLTWDWDWPPVARPPGAGPRRPSPEAVAAAGAEIVRSRILLLEVGYPTADALTDGELTHALRGFAGLLSVVLGPREAAALGGDRPWERAGAPEAWLDITPEPGEGAAVAVPPGWPAVRVHLTADNVVAAADAIERAVAAGARAVSLPNLPLFGAVLGEAVALAPGPGDLAAFADRVAPLLAAHGDLDLRVHHWGLLEQLRARGLSPHGEEAPGAPGCQAGTALAYLDPGGVLYPCASLPLPLARIGEGAIARAWAGSELEALRACLAALPAGCTGCAAAERCRGGCRGWAHLLAGDWETPGPDCTAPRR